MTCRDPLGWSVGDVEREMFVVVPDRGEQVGDVAVVQAVVTVASVPPDGDEPVLTQHPQLLRGGTVGEAVAGRQLLDRPLALK